MSRTVEEKIVTNVNNGDNNTFEVGRDMITIGQQNIKNSHFLFHHQKP
jgi:predicted secreted protein